MKKLLCISLLCVMLTGCGNKAKEVDEETAETSLEQQIEAAEDSIYTVMESIKTAYLSSVVDEEPKKIPLVVTCKEQGGTGICTYGDNEKISSSKEMPTAGTFTLNEDGKFDNTYDIVIDDLNCYLQNEAATCSKKEN